MENLGLITVIDVDFWRNKRVLVTGHTGFKGSWLCLWLQKMGANVCGYALAPPTSPSLFVEARIAADMRSESGDVRDLEALCRLFAEFKPEIVFHMAAQSLVRVSYDEPVATYATNVMGTIHVLEAARLMGGVKAIVNVTSDKCYENREMIWGYREPDAMGGYDPYSSSKGCAELVTSAYRNAFFNSADYARHGVALASVRAGNVIGGGDWAKDRLLPDMLRAFEQGASVEIRNPHAVRPWQHVLEPLSGYLLLAQRLYSEGASYAEGWNFGPQESDACPVASIVGMVAGYWGDNASWHLSTEAHPHEAHHLKLDCSKAKSRLGWSPRWSLSISLAAIVQWHRAWLAGEDMHHYSLEELDRFMTSQPM